MTRETTDAGRLELADLPRAAFSVRIVDTKQSLQGALQALATFATYHRFPQTALAHSQVAIDEIVTNIFSHGYDESSGIVELDVGLRGEFLELRIIDEAHQFNPLEQAKPELDLEIEDRPIGGLGVHIVLSLIDEVDYSWTGGKNLLRLRKRVVAAQTP